LDSKDKNIPYRANSRPDLWETKPLESITEYITEKIPISSIDSMKYISTENMISYKGGITAPETLPKNIKITKFLRGDILLSNIRPYFKKIWFAKFEGGCSQDVLVIRAKDGVMPWFLYYYLTQDSFFEYTVRSSKGTKMPRGDKNAIMSFPVNVPSPVEQKAISKILSDLDSKIELNQKMNKTLESIAQAIFKHWFIDFEFPDENGNPYRSSGGEMVDSELGKIPKRWSVSKLGDIGTLKNGVNYIRGESGDKEFFIVNVRDISKGKFLLKESLDRIRLDSIKAKQYLLDNDDIIIARSACPGETSVTVNSSNDVIYSGFSIRYRLDTPSNWLYIFLTLQNLKQRLSKFSVGTTLTSVNQESLKVLDFVSASNQVMKNFNKIAEELIYRVFANLNQSIVLSQIRDSILPKLMSGKIRVPLEE
jgi:type I restriction enzyme S subunit